MPKKISYSYTYHCYNGFVFLWYNLAALPMVRDCIISLTVQASLSASQPRKVKAYLQKGQTILRPQRPWRFFPLLLPWSVGINFVGAFTQTQFNTFLITWGQASGVLGLLLFDLIFHFNSSVNFSESTKTSEEKHSIKMWLHLEQLVHRP